MGVARRTSVLVVAAALALTGLNAVPQKASAEPGDPPDPPSECPTDIATCDIEYTSPLGFPILLDVYQPTSGTNLRAVVLIHGGGWRDGDKLGLNQIDVARHLRLQGLVVFVINYRLTCTTPKPISVSDGRLCVGLGHGTWDTNIEPYDDARAAILWARENATTYDVDPEKVGVLGLSAGGNLASLTGVRGTDGQARADAVVSWSGAMHLETPNKGDTTANDTVRERYIGCEYDYEAHVTCNDAWDTASPLHQCCSIGNAQADTPFLIFNSKDELVVRSEPDDMYDDLAGESIRATKVILDGTKHAASYWLEEIDISGGCSPSCDDWATNHGFNPDGLQVRRATADFFLSVM